MTLPEKTIERLSGYRRILLDCLAKGKTHVYSHELAALNHITAVQVRRDMMLMGFSSMQRKGYGVKELIDAIGVLIDTKKGLNIAVVGLGNLGRAVTTYFRGKRSKLNVVAIFDVDPEKIGRIVAGVKCYSDNDLPKLVKEMDISIVVLTVPPEQAVKSAETLVACGIKGILNLTTVPLNIPPNVFLEEHDMITSIEKVAYFVKNHQG
ncbi:MAG: redox-sensing transcriptional repressor Rex [Bacteroidales bacterium]|jgi:redox-sensing transcriptional repressor|nr:redox-sensing transcriptional repressor Rex [Bacteroidales bacterium]MDD2570265.1 redox-sensing transcriptional repressor Rex [Bacteroidales bacterium]MDD2811825.1 redox-sensing transcriptional repressor Rex [Bacteroidales bacterium]MDD3384341.1 redox-sensing transcriptional repressor Rex [Bacteroidales bacterium]MDD3810716.1 redox-sensing transcriptional repressor Rex [Bacteroidales bacterium]